MNTSKESHSVNPYEVATVFCVENEPVIGVLHKADERYDVGILILVGGRQYRTGAQRQFVRLARYLASSGFPVFRFDVRGMGDSKAESRHFLDTEADIHAAISEYRRLLPQLKRVILWGLCDGASAAIVFASKFEGIDGVMLVNPWITTKGSAVKATIKHYYFRRFFSAEFWRKLLNGKINILLSLRSIGVLFRQRYEHAKSNSTAEYSLPSIVFEAIERFKGDVTIIISEYDLTAKEFIDELDKKYKNGSTVLPNLKVHRVNADHTFSSVEQHVCLESLTLQWCQEQAKKISTK